MPGEVPSAQLYEVRVWLPDRPGALGDVAGRIGSVGADVVGIEILETGGGSAIDDLTVSLPADVSVDRLLEAIGRAHGVAVEEIVCLTRPRPDAAVAALEVVAAVAAAPAAERLARLCDELRTFIDGEWAAAIDTAGAGALARSGQIPDLNWLVAFLRGARHLGAPLGSDRRGNRGGDAGGPAGGPPGGQGGSRDHRGGPGGAPLDSLGDGAGSAETTPGDIVWCELPRHGAAVASGRSGRVFHARERDLVRRIGEIVDRLV